MKCICYFILKYFDKEANYKIYHTLQTKYFLSKPY